MCKSDENSSKLCRITNIRLVCDQFHFTMHRYHIESYIHSYKMINFLEMEFRSSYIPKEQYAVLRFKIRKLNLNY